MDRVHFTINGEKYTAGGEFSSDTTLNEFIRRCADLRGTKYMCKEGGCGACIVHVQVPQEHTNEVASFCVNSCLVLIMSCDNWCITTIEGIGNRKIGYHIIQKRLNHYFGSQCGYCSPGFVMSMYSLVQGGGLHLTEAEIENSFGSNLCRCTGYRPILEAFKSFAVNADRNVLKKIKDLEDIDQYVCPKSGKKCAGSCNGNELEEWCVINTTKQEVKPTLYKKISLSDGRVWFQVNEVRSIFETLDLTGYDSYMLVAGNTAKGVRPIISYPKVLIDISGIKELNMHYIDVNLVLGANMTLTDTMQLFRQLSKSNEEDFWYLELLRDHLERVAHISVRNIGTLAGNLVLKNKHPDFQSDIFLLFDCVGAIITLVDNKGTKTQVNLSEYLKTNLRGKVLTEIKLPPLSKHHKLVTYKITPREENAHAEVNAAFLFRFQPDTLKIMSTSIVYGGIRSYFTHAYHTEEYMIGRDIFNNEVLQGAINCLKSEIDPEENPPDPTPKFRKKLAVALFYKCILKLCPLEVLSPFYKSGSTTPTQDRPPVSHSYQEYDTNKKEYPITQPMLKREGMIQCAGEAIYSDDNPTMKDEVFAAFVLSHESKADVESIDGTEAMKINGVVAVLTSADIPGKNNIIRVGFSLLNEEEELLATKVRYYNQPVAIVVAKTQDIADRASNYVKVNYKNISNKPLILTIEDAIKAPREENRLTRYDGIIPTERGENVKKIINGQFYSPLQYHFMMELHTTVAIPLDDGLQIYCSTQFMDLVQAAIAQLLNISESLITITTRRCGGAFGGKISKANFAACAAALVAKKLNRPCRMATRLPDIMRSIGKRCNSRLDYEIGVDYQGEIQYMDAVFYINDGCTSNENENAFATDSIKNCYNPNRWKVDSYGTITDNPSNAFMRAPGGFEGISAIEHVMDRIAIELNQDPISVRKANYRKEDNTLPELVPMFTKRIELKKRQEFIEHFNAHNRWKKRGIKLSNMSFPTEYLGEYSALVSAYHGDGSVIVTIGGIEMGQGIYTRIAQIAANELQIPVETVHISSSYNFATPNNFTTGSSITTDCCAYCVMRACQEILARIAPVRASMPTATFQEILFAANEQGINLQANYLTSPNDPRLINYPVFGIAVTEVEIDVLTGRKWIVRADVFEDVGHSVNPALDIGQVEGAFIQSLSLWTLEEIKINGRTGELYTDRSWNYKIFGAKDIPHDFRVYLQRNSYNPVGILGSKAVSEPPTCLSYVIVESLREAIQASRRDSGYDKPGFYLRLDVPVSNEHVVDAAEVKFEEYLLY